MKDRKEQNKIILQTLSKMSNLIFSMVFSIVIGFAAGKFIDGKLGTTPIFIVIGTIFGVIAAFKNLYDITKKDREK